MLAVCKNTCCILVAGNYVNCCCFGQHFFINLYYTVIKQVHRRRYESRRLSKPKLH